MVTGLGVMLGKFMFESGGIESISNKILKAFGEKTFSYRSFSFRIYHRYSCIRRCCLHYVRANASCVIQENRNFYGKLCLCNFCSYNLYVCVVLPTAPPLAVAGELGIEIGIFFFYALISAFVGMIFGGIIYGAFLNKQDHKNNHFYTFEDLEADEAALDKVDNRKKMGAGKALSILLVPIILILLGSFVPLALGEESAVTPIVKFIGDKNFAMITSVIYPALISRKYLQNILLQIL